MWYFYNFKNLEWIFWKFGGRGNCPCPGVGPSLVVVAHCCYNLLKVENHVIHHSLGRNCFQPCWTVCLEECTQLVHLPKGLRKKEISNLAIALESYNQLVWREVHPFKTCQIPYWHGNITTKVIMKKVKPFEWVKLSNNLWNLSFELIIWEVWFCQITSA